MHQHYSTPEFEAAFTYSGSDLGAICTDSSTRFRVWAPTAQAVSLLLYSSSDPEDSTPPRELPMAPDVNGTWVLQVPETLSGTYYTYRCVLADKVQEACDPYARASGINGQRSMVLNLPSTDPPLWQEDHNPHAGEAITDAVIYELHIRDLSMERSAPFRHRGKFLALTETGLTTKGGNPIGLDHIRSLGVTHVQLLPVYDFGSVDERRPGYNWGYDPALYNVPEGSYSTDPWDGACRVRELKQTVKALHDAGLGVIMDVVYNHVYDPEQFCLNRIVPGFFCRIAPDGVYSNGSGCGNDTASERSMVQKYIIDSLLFWAQEYHMDGFRFDLAGLLDVETVRSAIRALHAVRPDLLLYGEGWSLPTVPTKRHTPLATQASAQQLAGFGFFNDFLRDLLRGSVFCPDQPGFAAGGPYSSRDLERAFMGMPPWHAEPTQCINYVSCHDNHTLFDRIALTAPDASAQERVSMNNLAAAFSILAQGVPFFQAGEEFLRSKPNPRGGFVENSYRSSDRVNALRWSTLDHPAQAQTLRYYQGLIAFRKAHPGLRLRTREEILSRVHPIAGQSGLVQFHIEEPTAQLLIAFNPTREPIILPLGDDRPWEAHIYGTQAGTRPLFQVSGQCTLAPISATVLVRRREVDVVAALIWEKDRFLICQRPAHKARGLLWEFVGGKVEPGESLTDALIRECREELGITVQPGAVFMQLNHDYPDILIRLTLFHCIISSGTPQLLEHNAMAWITPRQIPEYSFCPADADILKRIEKTYSHRPTL